MIYFLINENRLGNPIKHLDSIDVNSGDSNNNLEHYYSDDDCEKAFWKLAFTISEYDLQ